MSNGRSRGRSLAPIDELLQQPSVRILRALRWCDWVDSYDFRDVVLDCTYEDSRFAIAAALVRLVKAGFVEKRGVVTRGRAATRWNYEMRITRAGRAHLAALLKPDLTEEWAPARPGSEHLLCA